MCWCFSCRLLQPEQISRMDPEIMQKEHFEEMEEEAARLRLIELYRETVNGNLEKLHHRCDEFVKGLKFIDADGAAGLCVLRAADRAADSVNAGDRITAYG